MVPKRSTQIDGPLKAIGGICLILGVIATYSFWPKESGIGTVYFTLLIAFSSIASAFGYFAFAEVIRLLDEIRFHLSGESPVPLQRDEQEPWKKANHR
jgi:hypothetical protein